MAEPRPGSPSIVETSPGATDKSVEIALSTEKVEESLSPTASVFGADKSAKFKDAMSSATTIGGSDDRDVQSSAAKTNELAEPIASSDGASSASATVLDKSAKDIGYGEKDQTHISQSSDADGGETTKGDDVDFDPSSELNEYDDEATLDEEEELSRGSSNANELDDLAKQGDMPLEDLLAMYGYGNPKKCSSPGQPMSSTQSPVGKSPNYYGNGNSNSSSESEEILCNQDLTLDKDEIARDLRLSSRAPVAVDDLPEEITSLLEPPVPSVDDEADGLELTSRAKSSRDSVAQHPSRELRQRPQRLASKGVLGKHINNNKRRHSEMMLTATNDISQTPSAIKLHKDERAKLISTHPDSSSSKGEASVALPSKAAKVASSASSSSSFSSAMTSASLAETSTLSERSSSAAESTRSEGECANKELVQSSGKEVATGEVEMMKIDDVDASVSAATEQETSKGSPNSDGAPESTAGGLESNVSTSAPLEIAASAGDGVLIDVSESDRGDSVTCSADRIGSDASTPSGSEANPFGESPTHIERRGFEKSKAHPDKLDGLPSSSAKLSPAYSVPLQIRMPDSRATSCSALIKTSYKTETDMEFDSGDPPSRAVSKSKAAAKPEIAPAPYPIAITPAANYTASSSARSMGTLNQDIPGGSRRRLEDKEDRLGIERLLRSADTDSESEDEEDYEPADYWRKTISVGSMFQATIPKLERYESSGFPYPLESDTCLWHPRKMSQEQTVEYLHEVLQTSTEIQLAASAVAAGSRTSGGASSSACDATGPAPFSPPILNFGNGSHVKDEELALYILKRKSFNRKEAIKTYTHCLKGEMKARDLDTSQESPNSFTKTQVSWSEEECRAFEEGLRIYGKNFFLIKKNRLPSRTVMDLVQFYYLWKKTERHDVFANKNRLEKKKYALHPGITDYMDKFIEDHEDQLYHQMQQQHNPLIQHMQQPQMLHSSYHHTNQASMMALPNSPCSSQVPDLVGGEGLKSPTLNSLLYGASTANEIVNSFGINPSYVNQGAIDSASINSVLLDSSPQSRELSSSSSSTTAVPPSASELSISAEAVEALRAISHSLNNETIEDFVQIASQVVGAAAGGSALPQNQDLSNIMPGFSPPSPSVSSTSQPLQSNTALALAPTHLHNQPRGPLNVTQPNPQKHSPSPSSSSSSRVNHSDPSSSNEQQQRQLSPSGLRNFSSSTTMHSSSSEAKTISIALPVDPVGQANVNPPLPSSYALENQTRPDSSSSTRPHRLHDSKFSQEPSTSSSVAKKRLKPMRDGPIPPDGPLIQPPSLNESKNSSPSLSQLTFTSSSSSSSASSSSYSKLVGLEGTDKEVGIGLRNNSSPASPSSTKNFDNSDDHPLPSIQQQHFSQPSSVSSSSLNNDSSTSITLRGINT